MKILWALLLLLWSGSGEDTAVQAELKQWLRSAVAAAVAQQLPAGEPSGLPAPGVPSRPGSSGEPEPAEPESNPAGFAKRDPQKGTAPEVRGIYSTANSAGGSRLESLLELISSTDLNAIVIDVKNDWGEVTYSIRPEDHPLIAEYGTVQPVIRDIGELMRKLEEHDVYPIARIVVFKDSRLAAKRPDLSFTNPDGTVWTNNRGESFVNPYCEEVWDYNLEVAREAARAGFREIQFDYVRFPEGFENKADSLVYKKDGRTRTEVIGEFTRYAYERLNPLGVRVSVDIFGYTASVKAAEGIGQDFNLISKYVDVISPMVYPSHYSTGWFGLKVPDANPYETIAGAMRDTREKLAELGDEKPVVRPWIQDFTATWVPGHIPYRKEEVEAQIRALYDHGVREFLIWSPTNRYTTGVNYLLK